MGFSYGFLFIDLSNIFSRDSYPYIFYNLFVHWPSVQSNIGSMTISTSRVQHEENHICLVTMNIANIL
jgi:hypothetical protein